MQAHGLLLQDERDYGLQRHGAADMPPDCPAGCVGAAVTAFGPIERPAAVH